MLNIIPIVTTKKIAIEYIWKEWERNPNILLPKKELNTKDKNAENKKQKVYEAYRKEIAQWQIIHSWM